jgi:hypothetical protein
MRSGRTLATEGGDEGVEGRSGCTQEALQEGSAGGIRPQSTMRVAQFLHAGTEGRGIHEANALPAALVELELLK